MCVQEYKRSDNDFDQLVGRIIISYFFILQYIYFNLNSPGGKNHRIYFFYINIKKIGLFLIVIRHVQTWAVRFSVDLKFDLIGQISLYNTN